MTLAKQRERKFKIGDIVGWSDAFAPLVPNIEQGPFVIRGRRGDHWKIYGLRDPIVPNDYFLVKDSEIKLNVFLTAAKEAVALSTTNRSEKEKHIET